MIDSLKKPSIEAIRAQFPSMQNGFAYMENAGGSQVPGVVANAIRDYMLTSYVQTGAGYPQSEVATATVDKGHEFALRLMGGEGKGHAILGPSTTQLVTMLAGCYWRKLKSGDRIVIAENGHEANIGPWMPLTEKGIDVAFWKVDPETQSLRLEDLDWLLKTPTELLCLPHVSNLLGEVADVKEVAARAHKVGTRVFVDGVAYAPHRAMDVAAWDVDFYVYSTYKVYGPHMAVLYGKSDALAELTGPNHFFIPRDTVPYKYELGGANHEGCAGLLALGKYLNFLSGVDADAECTRQNVVNAFDLMGKLELPLQKRFIDFLLTKKDVQIVGPKATDETRIPTISFTHTSKKPTEIVAEIDKNGIGTRFGHMYSYRLCEALGIDLKEGVTRVSMVHYNSLDEVEKLIGVLDPLL